MSAAVHIFVHVVDRRDDPFAGIRRQLSSSAFRRHEILELRLSPEAYETVRRVEYSARKNWRFCYYREVFRQLDAALAQALAGHSQPAVVYFADEGVWAEFLRRFRARHPRRFLAVNVQHGFEHRVRPRGTRLRRVMNGLSTRLTGFPAFGLGSFGGAGRGVFDAYLTYDEETAAFASAYTGDLAFSCPELIKHAFITEVLAAREEARARVWPSDGVVFALQPRIAGMLNRPSIRFTPLQTMRHLVPLARLLAEKYRRRLRLRLHPGMDRRQVLRDYSRSGIAAFADIDDNPELAATLARCSLVLSYDSTVLWEALLVGVVPVSVQGPCFRGDLGFPHEVLNIDSGLPASLARLLSPATAAKYRSPGSKQPFDWEDLVSRLAHERLPRTQVAANSSALLSSRATQATSWNESA